jgi:Helix-turn-helix domain
VNPTTTRVGSTDATPRAGQISCAPFAALPHDIAADPRLSPTDVRVLLALLYYARSKPVCWPSDRSIGFRVGRSIGTIQRALRRLEAFGLVGRLKADNPTGRELVLRWRATPTAPATDRPAAPARDEGRRERERERPEPAAGREGPPPPAGREAAEPDLATLHQWAEGCDPILRRIAGRRLTELAAETKAAAEPVAIAEPMAPSPAAAPAPSPLTPPGTGSGSGRASTQGLPRPQGIAARRPAPAPAAPRRRGGVTRQVLDRLGPVPSSSVLGVWLTRRSP